MVPDIKFGFGFECRGISVWCHSILEMCVIEVWQCAGYMDYTASTPVCAGDIPHFVSFCDCVFECVGECDCGSGRAKRIYTCAVL